VEAFDVNEALSRCFAEERQEEKFSVALRNGRSRVSSDDNHFTSCFHVSDVDTSIHINTAE
jgi:hypothetical protein